MHLSLCVKNLADDAIFEACVSLINNKDSSPEGGVAPARAKVKVTNMILF